jgi:type III pantothenate kinase
MLLVIDVGNTRTKWALVGEDGNLQEVQTCFNNDFAATELKQSMKAATKIMVSNVAGKAMAEQISALALETPITFISAQEEACNVYNRYQPPQSLGSDRWAALVAAWRMHKQPTIVVNAGTAVTIDALERDAGAKRGVFVGGNIVPGLRLMLESLGSNTAQLKVVTEGKSILFPLGTQDAVQTGCMNAVVGAILLVLQQLEKHCAYLPKLIISGGDAEKIAEALKPQIKRVMIVENLVLQGLVLLEKETL